MKSKTTTVELSAAERYDRAQTRLIEAQKELAEAREALCSEMRQSMFVDVDDYKLTKREKEVLLLVKQCLCNKDVACKLNISERTVKFHVSNLLNKFGVQSRHELF